MRPWTPVMHSKWQLSHDTVGLVGLHPSRRSLDWEPALERQSFTSGDRKLRMRCRVTRILNLLKSVKSVLAVPIRTRFKEFATPDRFVIGDASQCKVFLPCERFCPLEPRADQVWRNLRWHHPWYLCTRFRYVDNSSTSTSILFLSTV